MYKVPTPGVSADAARDTALGSVFFRLLPPLPITRPDHLKYSIVVEHLGEVVVLRDDPALVNLVEGEGRDLG
jgi:hypothetical protein